MPTVKFPVAVDRFDAAVEEYFGKLRGHHSADLLFYGASALGDNSLIWHLIGAARGLRSEQHFQEAVRLSVTLGIESALVNGLIKSLIRRERPVHEGLRPRKLRNPRTSSFPSGDASSAFVAAGLLSDGDRLAPVYYALGVIVAKSRIYTRIHHPSDVVVGAAIGIAIAKAAKRIAPISHPGSVTP